MIIDRDNNPVVYSKKMYINNYIEGQYKYLYHDGNFSIGNYVKEKQNGLYFQYLNYNKKFLLKDCFIKYYDNLRVSLPIFYGYNSKNNIIISSYKILY